MSNPLRSPEDYELYIYTLTTHYATVRRSTITFVRLGASLPESRASCYLITISASLSASVLCTTVYQR